MKHAVQYLYFENVAIIRYLGMALLPFPDTWIKITLYQTLEW